MQGTTYTMANTRNVTTTTTASNYEFDNKTLVPVYPNVPEGPYVNRPGELAMPSKYILTKTHCGGYCTNCKPNRYALDVAKFDEACRTSRVKSSNQTTSWTYPKSRIDKAIHLIRDPFDNIISRLHFASKKVQRLSGLSVDQLQRFSQSERAGYLAWCDYLDSSQYSQMLESRLISDSVKTFLRENTLPCASEWFRYVRWHNLAIELENNNVNMRVLYLHYESYSTNYNQTLQSILDFLELPWNRKSLPFIAGKTYHTYYTVNEAQVAKKFVEMFATPEVWVHIERYFNWF